MEIKRYEQYFVPEDWDDMIESKCGDWVKYSDIEKIVYSILDSLCDMWTQCAYRRGNNQEYLTNGGLSTLENCEDILREYNLLDKNGNVNWEALEKIKQEENRIED